MNKETKTNFYEALKKSDIAIRTKTKQVDKYQTRKDTTYIFGTYKLIYSEYKVSALGKTTMWTISLVKKGKLICETKQFDKPNKVLYRMYLAAKAKALIKNNNKKAITSKSDLNAIMIHFNDVMSYELPRMLPSEFMPYTQEITDKLGADLMKIILQYKVRTK